MSMGLVCHLVSINYLDHDIPFINSVPIVKEFQDVFLDDFRGLPPLRDIEFPIDIKPDTKQIFIPPYRTTLADFKELQLQ